MRQQSSLRKLVTIQIPPWFWGGASRGYFSAAGLHARDVGGVIRIRTDESYHRTRPRLVTEQAIAGPGKRKPAFADLASAAARTGFESRVLEPATAQELDELGRRAAASGDLVDRFEHLRLTASVVPHARLPDHIEHAYRALTSTTLEGDPSVLPFAHAGIHLVQRDPMLLHRTKLPAVLLRLRYDEKLRSGQTRHLSELLAERKPAFASGQDMLRGLYLLDDYIGPLLGSLTPDVWGFAGHRSFGAILFSLGTTVAGTRRGPAEMLHLLPHLSRSATTWSRPQLAASSCGNAVRWWANGLNEFFGVLSDPVVFADASDTYDPAAHHQALMTAEQLFARVATMLTLHRDVRAQMVLFFTVMDTLERMTGKPIETLCELTHVRKVFAGLQQSIPAPAAAVLLPLAERGVVALQDLQQGFFLDAAALGTRERAAARYVKLLRNATHGHGAKKAGSVQETNLLLAAHNGAVPPDLAMLVFLHLLVLLAHPRELRRHLSGGRSG
ncbi:hypothetical protein [Actinoplanes sp. URMC 104]|uniref:hypothetical protein n=1 Tax=Actinoplanes sp. URMC 104 TaxID=3423409 RepID=UPI003F1BC93B